MCLSAQGDLVGGAIVVAIGVDACRHLRGRTEYLFVAGLPLLLGLHQLIEAFVWWGLQGHVPERLGEVAMWIYLLFALVALPVLIPALVLRLQPTAARRWRIVPLLAVGLLVGGVLLGSMVRTPPVASLSGLHIAYRIGWGNALVMGGLYVLATCGAMVASGLRHVVWFGLANLVVAVTLARLSADGFASMWCFYAALVSGAIAVYMRIGEPEVDDTPMPVGGAG